MSIFVLGDTVAHLRRVRAIDVWIALVVAVIAFAAGYGDVAAIGGLYVVVSLQTSIGKLRTLAERDALLIGQLQQTTQRNLDAVDALIVVEHQRRERDSTLARLHVESMMTQPSRESF